MPSWNQELDFDERRAALRADFEAAKAKFEDPNWTSRDPIHIAILLTQLTNSSRVSEAYEGLHLWVLNGNRLNTIRARKHGKILKCLQCSPPQSWKTRGKGKGLAELHTKDTGHPLQEEYVDFPRKIGIPDEIAETDREALASLWDEHATVSATRLYSYNKQKHNTHSLRYAGISKLPELGVPVQVGMKITGHANVEQFVKYQEQRQADQALAKMMKAPRRARTPAAPSETEGA